MIDLIALLLNFHHGRFAQKSQMNENLGPSVLHRTERNPESFSGQKNSTTFYAIVQLMTEILS